MEPDVVAYACNPSTQRLRKEDHKFKDSLGYIARSCLKTTVATIKPQ
jgi:hypothetical protein